MVKFWRAEKSVYNTGLLLKLGASRDLSLLTISGNIAMNAAASQDTPLVGIIMGSQSDWATLEHTANMLKQLGVPFEAEVVSAHRTPDRLFEYAVQWLKPDAADAYLFAWSKHQHRTKAYFQTQG
jgi:5-(carboxyamino)imidazole ribonucleotide mutase